MRTSGRRKIAGSSLFRGMGAGYREDMQANEVTTERLRRLAETRPGDGGKVLSVYVDLDPSEFATGPARATAITSVLDEAERELRDAPALERRAREGLRSGLERVRTFLEQEFDASGAHGVALFCDSGQDLFEALKLPVGVGHKAVIDDAPFVEPLAGLDATARFLVVLCNRRVGRLLLGSADGLREVARVESDVHGQHRQGGLSQPRYERSVDNEALHHVRRVGELAGRRFGRRALDGVLLGAPEEMLGRLEASLPNGLRTRIAGRVEVDVDTASPESVLASAGHVLQRIHREHEDEALDRLREGLSGGPRPAAARIADVLVALNERRVETLVIAAGTTATGRECPQCGWLGVAGDVCPADGSATAARDDIIGPAVQRALMQSADVRVLRRREADGEPAVAGPLDLYGGIGAVLRF
jgi:peptide chain release factor subunit 1